MMEFSLPLPQFLDPSGELLGQWISFHQRFQTHKDSHSCPESCSESTSLLLHAAHQQIISVRARLEILDVDLSKLNMALKIIEEICLPHFLLLFERFRFFTLKQDISETLNDFVFSLERQAGLCEFGEFKESAMVTALTYGVQDSSLKCKVISLEGLTLKQAVDLCREKAEPGKRDQMSNTNHVELEEKCQQRDVECEIHSVVSDADSSLKDEAKVTQFRDASEHTYIQKQTLLFSEPFRKVMDHVGRKRQQSTDIKQESINDWKSDTASPDKTGSENKPKKRSNASHCFLCDKAFAGAKYLRNHIASFHKDCRKCLCHQCGKKLRDVAHCLQHFSYHFPEVRLENEKSEPKFTRTKKLKILTPTLFQCFLCDENFSTGQFMKAHIRTMHPNCANFSCRHCGKVFTDLQKFNRHLKRMHNGLKRHTCELCNKSYPHLPNLVRHVRNHLNLRSFQCEICGKSFNEPQVLVTHRRSHSAVNLHKCQECGRGCSTPAALRRHMQTHTGERPYTCELCGKSYADRCALKYHHHWHAGELPYSCEICGKQTRSVREKNKHKRIHTDRLPFVCEFCGKRFKFDSGLNDHKKVHMNEWTYTYDTVGLPYTELA